MPSKDTSVLSLFAFKLFKANEALANHKKSLFIKIRKKGIKSYTIQVKLMNFALQRYCLGPSKN